MNDPTPPPPPPSAATCFLCSRPALVLHPDGMAYLCGTHAIECGVMEEPRAAPVLVVEEFRATLEALRSSNRITSSFAAGKLRDHDAAFRATIGQVADALHTAETRARDLQMELGVVSGPLDQSDMDALWFGLNRGEEPTPLTLQRLVVKANALLTLMDEAYSRYHTVTAERDAARAEWAGLSTTSLVVAIGVLESASERRADHNACYDSTCEDYDSVADLLQAEVDRRTATALGHPLPPLDPPRMGEEGDALGIFDTPDPPAPGGPAC